VGPISGGELIVLLALAAIVLGPERLPNYAQQLARLVRELRRMAQGATAQVRQEMGDEFNDVDWKKLDPRQYDPRKIVREALADDDWDDDDPFGFKGLAKDVNAVVRDEPAGAGAGGDGAAKRNGSSAGGSSAGGSSADAISDDIT
jgi:sec-independent protein translocase protein TatB